MASELKRMVRAQREHDRARAKQEKQETWHGVFCWREDGKYPEKDAVIVMKSKKLAQKHADKGNFECIESRGLVVRTVRRSV